VAGRAKRSNILLGAFILFGLAALTAAYYAAIMPREHAFGERYVEPELPLLFPFYVLTTFKPITIMSYLIFAGWVLLLEAKRDWLSRSSRFGLRIILLLGAFVSGYELIWNFFAWFAVWLRDGGILDLLVNTQHEYTQLPWNFNFATKVSFLVLAMCLYGLAYLFWVSKHSR